MIWAGDEQCVIDGCGSAMVKTRLYIVRTIIVTLFAVHVQEEF
ncbi:hypothetical protein [Roseiflexus castenholzii]|nr:hypothetical protein [Roseiflexus castenholzii]GIV98700.1 MAG: hypothetical protein KatS3mg058_0104 [Roseiflexus sp.]